MSKVNAFIDYRCKEIDVYTVALDKDKLIATVFYGHHTWLISEGTTERPWDDLHTLNKETCVFTADETLGSIARLRDMCEAASAIWGSDLYGVCVHKVKDYLAVLQGID